jgi:hypothetical protein
MSTFTLSTKTSAGLTGYLSADLGLSTAEEAGLFTLDHLEGRTCCIRSVVGRRPYMAFSWPPSPRDTLHWQAGRGENTQWELSRLEDGRVILFAGLLSMNVLSLHPEEDYPVLRPYPAGKVQAWTMTAIPEPLSVDELQHRIRQKRVPPPDEKELLRAQVAALTARNAVQEEIIRGLQDRLLIIKAACS